MVAIPMSRLRTLMAVQERLTKQDNPNPRLHRQLVKTYNELLTRRPNLPKDKVVA